MRVLACVFLDGAGGAAVGVAFAQHRVDGRAQTLAVAHLDGFFFVGLGVFREVRNGVALALEFLDGGDQLSHRGTDIGQLDDVGLGAQRQFAQLIEVVGHLLLGLEEVRKFSQNAGGH